MISAGSWLPAAITVLVMRGIGWLVVDGERAAPIAQRAVVHDRDAGCGYALAHEAGEGRGLLAVEIAFEPVADRLVQQDAGPAWPEDHLHFAGGRGDRIQIDEGLAHGFVDAVLPIGRINNLAERKTPAPAEAPAFLALALAHHDGHAEAHERADVGQALAVGAQDLYRLPFARDRAHDLAHARIFGARIGVDVGEQLGLLCKGHQFERIVVGIEARIRPLGPVGSRTARIAGFGGRNRARRALDGAMAQVGRMRIGGRFARNGAQAEALRGVERSAFELAVVEGQALGLAVFEIKLAVVHAGKGRFGLRLGPREVEIAVCEKQRVGAGKMAHGRGQAPKDGGTQKNVGVLAPISKLRGFPQVRGQGWPR